MSKVLDLVILFGLISETRIIEAKAASTESYSSLFSPHSALPTGTLDI
jgi:hypothetical protein